MKRTKVLLFVLVLVMFGLFFSGAKFRAAEIQTSDEITVLGAQVRTDDPLGIRFVGKAEGEYDKYGIAIAFGKATAEEVVLGATVNGEVVLSAEASSKDEDGQFYISLISIPENMYVQDVTARAYVVKDGVYTYSTEVAVRNLAQVSLAVKNAGGEVVESVIEYVEENYMMMFTDEEGNICFNNILSDANENDFNKTFIKIGESITLPSYEAKDGYSWKGYFDGVSYYDSEYVVTKDNATLIPTASLINYNITFINGDEEVAELSKTYTVNDEFNLPDLVIEGYDFLGWYTSETLEEGTKVVSIEKGTTGDKVYYASLKKKIADVNVKFNTDGGYIGLYESVEDAIADFLKDYNQYKGSSYTASSFYELGIWGEISPASLFLYKEPYKTKWTWLVNYIATVASSANKQAFTDFYKYNSQAELNAANENHIYRVAYELRGWVGQAEYSKNGNFVTNDYSTANSKAKYIEAVSLPTEYVYNEACDLPIPSKENHTFLGWVSSLTDTIVTTFDSYTENPGDITYTAQWKANYATVKATFDTNGGSLPMSFDANSKAVTVYDNVGGANGTYLCDTSITSKNSLRWQYKVLLEYSEEYNAYKVVCLDAAKASANNAATAAGVTWTHALSNASSNISTQYEVGQYIIFDGKPTVGQKNISYIVVSDPTIKYVYPTSTTMTYTVPTSLIIPFRDGYKFVGWKSSVDGLVVTEFPGYIVNPGDITYTAQWEANN